MFLKPLALTAAFAMIAFGQGKDPLLPLTPPDSGIGGEPASAPVAASIPPIRKSPGLALGLSLIGTAAPLLLAAYMGSTTVDDMTLPILMIGGAIAGPSLGQFYAASPTTGILGIVLRGTGAISLLSGLKADIDGERCDKDGICRDRGGTTQYIAGTLLLVGGTAFSLIEAAFAANRFNSKRIAGNDFGWAPSVALGIDGSMRTGALAYLRF